MMVPGEGGGLGLGHFVLYNERKLIEKEGARGESERRRGRPDETWLWKARVRPSRPLVEPCQVTRGPHLS